MKKGNFWKRRIVAGILCSTMLLPGSFVMPAYATEGAQIAAQSEEGIMTMALGSCAMAIVDKSDGKIGKAEDFSLGSVSSNSFTVSLAMNTSAKETFQFTIPVGFTATIRNVDGFTLSQEVQANGDTVYTYVANNATAQGNYECAVTVDYAKILKNVSNATNPRTEYNFTSKIVSSDGATTTEAGHFTIKVPELADLTLKQVDTTSNDFTWNPYQLAGSAVNNPIVHINNGAATSRPSKMTKPLQIEIDKETNKIFPNKMSLEIPLPLRMAIATARADGAIATAEICINGTWVSIPNQTDANNKNTRGGYNRLFQVISETTLPGSGFNAVTSNKYMLPSNMNLNTYVNQWELAMRTDLIDGVNIGATTQPYYLLTVNGTTKSIYEWLTVATGVRLNIYTDVMWDPVYNGQTAESQLTADNLKDGTETYTAAEKATLKTEGTTVTAAEPVVMKVTNGTDQTMKVDIATIDKIPMDVTTTKTTIGSGGGVNGISTTVQNGYVAAFGTAKNNNYSYFTNMEASYDFPWEYSPTGTITLCPLSQNGNYDSERNLTCYDYTITISNTSGRPPRVIPLPHTGYYDKVTGKSNPTSAANPGLTSPDSYIPDLADDEWVSNITVKAEKVWKQSLTTDTSVLTTATANHPLFYANCTSKSTDVDGTIHDNNTPVYVKGSISTDQTETSDVKKTVILVKPVDNAVIYGVDDSALRYPIGYYDNNKLEYIELHYKKYTDTPVYKNPYIEITGDALGILNKVTYASNVGTAEKPVYNYLDLRGYRLNDGSWVDVNETEAAALLNSAEGYYDLTDKIPDGKYLTGLRMAPLVQNELTVDTTSTPTDTDKTDGTVKHYLDSTYYLYLYDKVLPGYLGYDQTVKKTYTPNSITTLSSPLEYDLSFHCDYISAGHPGTDHLKDGMTKDDTRSATLIFGDLPEKIFGRDNDYDVAASPEGSDWRKYYVTELTNVAIDDGPAASSSINAWAEMKKATLRFSNSTDQEKRMLALTKGVSLIGTNWQGNSYLLNEALTATVRYKTNKSTDWITVTDPYKVLKESRDDRAVNYFELAADEYVTDVEVDYPIEMLYRAGYLKAGGPESNDMMNLQLPDVGLLTKGQIPFVSPVEGDDYEFQNGDTLDYHADLTFTDLAEKTHTLLLDYTTARLQPYPTMLVDNFTSSVTYANASDQASTYVYQGGILKASFSHKYSFTAETGSIDTEKIIHPTLCYQLDSNFTIEDTADLANILGVNPNQVTLTPKNDGSGDSILKIEYGPQKPRDRDIEFQIEPPLKTKPNAKAVNVVPIKNVWMTLDYDTTLDPKQEKEYVEINPSSTQKESNPEKVLADSDWTDGKRVALVTPLTSSLNINRYQASSMVFAGTDGNGGGISQMVKGHDSTDENTFGMTQTLYAPIDPSTNWVVYVAMPAKGQTVTYGNNQTAGKSEYTLIPSQPLQLGAIEGTNYTEYYWVPNDAANLVPSMTALEVNEHESVDDMIRKDATADTGKGDWMTWDDVVKNNSIEKVTYARIIADKVPGDAQLSSSLLMKLKQESAKTQVEDMYAYTALAYNYVLTNGNPAFPKPTEEDADTLTNLEAHGGKASSLVTYVLTDYKITGQLWQEKNFNNTYDTSKGDVLTDQYMSLILRDKDGKVIYHKDGTTENVVTIKTDGTYEVLVPSKGTYYLTLQTTDEHEEWLPVTPVEDKVMNGMRFATGIGSDGKEITDPTKATATIEVTNSDIQNINGGIEQWGTLTVDKTIARRKYADLTKAFTFIIKPNGTSYTRTYDGTYTLKGEEQTIKLTGGSDNQISLADKGTFTVRLPVGLEYTVTDSTAVAEQNDPASLWISNIKTEENGIVKTPSGITLNDGTGDPDLKDSYPAKTVTNQVVEITYTDSEGNGGNEEHFLNERKDVIPSGIRHTESALRIFFLFLVVFGGIFYYIGACRRKRRGGSRL